MTTRDARSTATSSELRFGFGRSILFSMILITLFFTCVELGVRSWARYLRDPVERWDSEAGTFTLAPGDYKGGIKINADGFVGSELEADGPDLWRIYALGDSCTFGAGNDRNTYAAKLAERLQERERPALRYEVINAGISGLNSQLALRRLIAKGPQVSPDVVTIYIGWNDLMKYNPLAQEESSSLSGGARALNNLWLVKGLRKLIFFYVRPMLHPPTTGLESSTGRFAGFSPTFYEENLRSIVDQSRFLGAQPFLITLPTVVRASMTPRDLREARVVFPYFRGANAVGDFRGLLDAYNRSIRRVSLDKRVPLLDLSRRFDNYQSVRELFIDTMHPTQRGAETIAIELEHALDREGLLGPVGRRS